MKEVGFAIVGLGNIAPVHAESIAAVKGARLVAVVEQQKARGTKFVREYGGELYTDYSKMLERDDVQVVNLCVPSGLRAEIAVACARAGKHVMSEKPLEVTTKRVDRIIRACDKAGVLLGCIFQNRFADDPCQVKKAIDQGRFGKLILGDASIKWYRTQAYYDSGAWRGTWALDGGGALMNQGIHQVDMLLWYFGDVKTVRAQTALVAHEGLEVEDLASVLLEFESGAHGVIEASTAIYPGHPARVEVHGTDGSAVLEDGKIRFWKFKKRKPVDKKIEAGFGGASELGSGAADPMAALKFEGHRRQIEDFARAVRTGKPSTIDGREGRRAVHLIEAIYRSARTGRAVKL